MQYFVVYQNGNQETWIAEEFEPSVKNVPYVRIKKIGSVAGSPIKDREVKYEIPVFEKKGQVGSIKVFDDGSFKSGETRVVPV